MSVRKTRGRLLAVALGAAGAVGLWPSGADASIYWSDSDNDSQISRANSAGTIVTPSFITGLKPFPQDLDARNSFLYFGSTNFGDIASGHPIGRANLDGTGLNTAFGPDDVATFAVLATDSYIYYSGDVGNNIYRSDLNGNNRELIVPGVDGALGLATDGTYLYWGSQNQGSIGRSLLDGSNPNYNFYLYPGNPGDNIDGVGGLAVDGPYLYFSSRPTGDPGHQGVSRINLSDGSGFQTVINESPVDDVDIVNGKLYYSVPGEGRIGRANPDGSDLNPTFITGAGTPAGLAIVADTTAPTCGTLVVRRDPNGDEADVTVTDPGSGIGSITNLTATNGTFRISPFSPGDPSATITSVKTQQGTPTHFEFDVTDGDGNTRHCV